MSILFVDPANCASQLAAATQKWGGFISIMVDGEYGHEINDCMDELTIWLVSRSTNINTRFMGCC